MGKVESSNTNSVVMIFRVQDYVEKKLTPSLVFGLFPLRRRKEAYFLTGFAFYPGIMTVNLIVYALYCVIQQSPKTLVEWLDGFMLVINCFMFLLTFIMPILRKDEFNSALFSIIGIHNTLKVPKYTVLNCHPLALLVLTAVVLRTVFGVETHRFNKLAFFWWSVYASILISDQFIVLVGVIGSQFSALRLGLIRAVASHQKYVSYGTITTSFHELVVASTKVNKVYTYQLLAIFSNIFFKGTSELYIALDSVSEGKLAEDGRDYVLLTIKLCWFLVSLGLALFIVAACERANKEVRDFNNLLYQLMIDDKTNEIINNQKLRLHISMKRDLVFSAAGFFSLDYTLIHSMIASATTYLVILIQFGQPSGPLSYLSATEPTNVTSPISSANHSEFPSTPS